MNKFPCAFFPKGRLLIPSEESPGDCHKWTRVQEGRCLRWEVRAVASKDRLFKKRHNSEAGKRSKLQPRLRALSYFCLVTPPVPKFPYLCNSLQNLISHPRALLRGKRGEESTSYFLVQCKQDASSFHLKQRKKSPSLAFQR